MTLTKGQLLFLYITNMDKDYWYHKSFFTENFLNACTKEELDVILEHVGSKIEEAKSRNQRRLLRAPYSFVA